MGNVNIKNALTIFWSWEKEGHLHLMWTACSDFYSDLCCIWQAAPDTVLEDPHMIKISAKLLN